MIFKVGQEWCTASAKDVSNAAATCIDHVFSCENNPALQTWIGQTQSPGILISDIGDMHESVLTDARSGMPVARPTATAVFCGWVCVDTLLGCFGGCM